MDKPPGSAHQITGTQAFVAGTHIFNSMAWDVIRAMGYLVSAFVKMTGNSLDL